jgi:hypothetical protein
MSVSSSERVSEVKARIALMGGVPAEFDVLYLLEPLRTESHYRLEDYGIVDGSEPLRVRPAP